MTIDGVVPSSVHARSRGLPPEVMQGSGDPQTAHLEEGEVHIWCVDLDRTPVAGRNDWAVLSTDERLRANRFSLPTQRKRFIVGRAALRRILAGYLGVDPAELKYDFGPFGKPCLGSAQVEGIAFNVSHSHSILLVAVARNAEVGIDLEQIRSELVSADLVARHFSDCERKALANLPERELTSAFFSIWTEKEALMKAMGYGLSQPLQCFNVRPGAGAAGNSTIMPNPPGPDRWYIHTLDIHPDFACALAVSSAVERLRIFDCDKVSPRSSRGSLGSANIVENGLRPVSRLGLAEDDLSRLHI
jgi:4'-phosphopantetheinyl transferase